MDDIPMSLWDKAGHASWEERLRGLSGLLKASFLRIWWRLMLRRVHVGAWTRAYGTVIVRGSGRVRIGKGCILAGDTTKPIVLVTQNPSAEILIGDNVGLNGVTIQCARSVVIGDNSAIAAYYITDSQNHSLSVDRRSSRVAPVEKKPVVIGRNVWVSVLTTILHGVVIGDNSVIGANSLVTHDIPADWLAYGTPAVPIRRLDGVGEE